MDPVFPPSVLGKLTQPSPGAGRKGASTCTQQQQQQQHSFLTHSTIYRRNEARRARTLAQRHRDDTNKGGADERPALVRVVAGLPGFRTLLPPRTARTTATTTADAAHAPENTYGSFADEPTLESTTIFSTSFSSDTTSHDDSLSASSTSAPSLYAVASSAAVAASFSSGLLERQHRHQHQQSRRSIRAVLGTTQTSVSTTTSARRGGSPFHVLASSSSRGGIVSWVAPTAPPTRQAVSSWSSSSSSSSFRGALSPSHLLLHRGGAAALLFGTQAAVQQQLASMTNVHANTHTHTHTHHANTTWATSLLSYAVAGGVLAAWRAGLAVSRSTLRTGPLGAGGATGIPGIVRVLPTPSSTSGTGARVNAAVTPLVSRHVQGAMAYFWVYDTARQWTAPTPAPSLLAGQHLASIAFAGALAGSVYEVILRAGSCTGGTMFMILPTCTSGGTGTTSLLLSHVTRIIGSHPTVAGAGADAAAVTAAVGRRSMGWTVARAAPFHAMLFVTYELLTTTATTTTTTPTTIA